MNIVVSYKIPEEGIDLLKQHTYTLHVHEEETPLSKEELMTLLKTTKADALLCLLTDTIDEEVMKASPSLKVISNYAVGYNNIDIEAAKRNSIAVTNTPGVLTNSVAEHTVSLLLSSMRRIVEADAFTRKGEYKGWRPQLFLGDDLSTKTICIIGGGRIGTRVAEIIHKGFSSSIIYHDVAPREEMETLSRARFFPSLDEALKDADVVLIHLPLLESTHHLFNRERFHAMKKGAYLVNTSRGAIVEENALVQALKENNLKGVALDVFENEPLVSQSLIDDPRVILTPHIASATYETRGAMSCLAAQNIINILSGKEPLHRVV